MKFVDPKPEHLFWPRPGEASCYSASHVRHPRVRGARCRPGPAEAALPAEHYSHLADVLGDTIFDPAPFWLSALDAQMRDQTIVESGQSRRHGSGEYFFKAGDPSKLLFLTDEFAKLRHVNEVRVAR